MMLQLDSQIREVGLNYLNRFCGEKRGRKPACGACEGSVDLLLLITNQYFLNPLLYPMTPEEERGALVL